MAREWLIVATEAIVPIIDWIALICIAVGTVDCVIRVAHATLVDPSGGVLRAIWLRYARWLVAGLTFQLAADILETAIAPSWDDIGRLAAIAVIRTFLDYFLGRDVDEIRERQSEPKVSAADPSAALATENTGRSR